VLFLIGLCPLLDGSIPTKHDPNANAVIEFIEGIDDGIAGELDGF
jgi:hypothetical protein